MKDLMKPHYFVHYAAFVEATWVLLGESIAEYKLEKCTNLLVYFVSNIESLYGQKYCTLNVHQCLHCVHDLGPLWVYSCFHFESLNSLLLKLFHGTQNVQTQIVAAVNMHQMLPTVIKSIPVVYQEVSSVIKVTVKRCTSRGVEPVGMCIVWDTWKRQQVTVWLLCMIESCCRANVTTRLITRESKEEIHTLFIICRKTNKHVTLDMLCITKCRNSTVIVKMNVQEPTTSAGCSLIKMFTL